jgi:uncharacterized membrane protein (GlpM family)
MGAILLKTRWRTMQWLFRFLIGGAVVSLFAMAADILRPKGFAGLFSAAPSVALATLALTALKEGPAYVALEARSMVLGAIALFVYASGCVALMAKHHLKAGASSMIMLLGWVAVAITLRFALLG